MTRNKRFNINLDKDLDEIYLIVEVSPSYKRIKFLKLNGAALTLDTMEGKPYFKPYWYEYVYYYILSPFRLVSGFWGRLNTDQKIAIIFNVFATTTSIIAIIISLMALDKN